MPPPVPFDQTFAMRLRAAYLTLHRRFNARFAEKGATADQFVLLSLVAENPGITQAQLGRLSASDPNTITAMLRVLIRRGLVRRESHAADARARCVHLTPAGERLHAELVEWSAGLHGLLESSLSLGERQALEAALDQITGAMTVAKPVRGREIAGQK